MAGQAGRDARGCRARWIGGPCKVTRRHSWQIAPRWYHYCKKMRLNPQLYWKMVGPDGKPGGTDHDIITGDAYVGHGTAPWISEM